MEIFTAGTTYVIAALLVAFILVFIAKQGKGGFVGFIITECEAVFDELGGDLKEYEPERYKELKELLDAMKKMSKDDVSVGEILVFVTKASKEFEAIADKYGIEFKIKK